MSGQPQVSAPAGRHLRLLPREHIRTVPRWRFVVRGVVTWFALGAVLAVAAAVLAMPALAQGDLSAAEAAIKAGNSRAARQIAEAALKASPDDAAAHYWLGRAAFAESRWGEATGHFENATKAGPKTSLYFEWFGNALGNEARAASKLRQPFLAKRMKAAWETAIQLDPETVEARASLIQFYVQAPGFMGGSKEKAFATAEEIKRLNPLRGWEEIGRLHERDKRWNEAEQAYLAAAALPAERPFMQFRLALLYASSGQYERSLETYEALAKAHPEERAALFAIGRVAGLSGLRLERGAEALQLYLSQTPKATEPTVANAQFRLGVIRERQGRRDDARAAYQTALGLDPKHKDASAALKKLS